MHLVYWKIKLNEQRELILKLIHCACATLAPQEISFLRRAPTMPPRLSPDKLHTPMSPYAHQHIQPPEIIVAPL